MSQSKSFDSELYDADDNAKDMFIGFLWVKGFDNPRVNPDQYGIDVLAEHDGERYAFEVEVKHNWQTQDFPFETVHYAARKTKFFSIDGIDPINTHFITINHQRDTALRIDATILAQCPIITKPTIYTTEENFIEVPAEVCSFFTLD